MTGAASLESSSSRQPFVKVKPARVGLIVKETGSRPESQTLFDGISCFTCSVSSSGLRTDGGFVTVPLSPERLRDASPLDDELDVAPGRQDLAQLGGSVAVGPPQRDAVREPADHQVLRVDLELGVRDLGWFWKT